MFNPLPLLIGGRGVPLDNKLFYWYLHVYQIIKEKLFYYYYYTTYNLGEDNEHYLSKIPGFLADVYKDAPNPDILITEILRIYHEINQKYILPYEFAPLLQEKIDVLIGAVIQMYFILNDKSETTLKGGYLKPWKTKKHKRYNKYKKVQRKSKKGRRKY